MNLYQSMNTEKDLFPLHGHRFRFWVGFIHGIHISVEEEVVCFRCRAVAGEQEVYQRIYHVYGQLSALDTDGWGLLEFRFVPQMADSRIRFTIRNEELKEKPLYLDELLIRHEVGEIFRREDGYVWKNNRWFPLEAIKK